MTHHINPRKFLIASLLILSVLEIGMEMFGVCIPACCALPDFIGKECPSLVASPNVA